MQTKQITIKEINKMNWYECCKLKVSEAQQRYLEPNAISILQSKFEQTLKPYGIYLNDKMKK